MFVRPEEPKLVNGPDSGLEDSQVEKREIEGSPECKEEEEKRQGRRGR